MNDMKGDGRDSSQMGSDKKVLIINKLIEMNSDKEVLDEIKGKIIKWKSLAKGSIEKIPG